MNPRLCRKQPPKEYLTMKFTKKGQALLETIFILPVLIFLILFGFQIFKAIFSAQVTQEKVRHEFLKNHIRHESNGAINMREKKTYSDMSPLSIQTQGLPLLQGTSVQNIDITIGICREVNCQREDP